MKKKLKIAFPKGRIQASILETFEHANYQCLCAHGRSLKLICNDDNLDIRVVRFQAVASMVESGAFHVGFTTQDHLAEKNLNGLEYLNTGLDPVQLVVAVPESYLEESFFTNLETPVIASQFPNLAKKWAEKKGLSHFQILETHGATEAYAPDIASLIIDVCKTGETLRANGLKILEVLMKSTTSMVVNSKALQDPHYLNLINSLRDRLAVALATERPEVNDDQYRNAYGSNVQKFSPRY